jgi:predicted phage tail protein
VAGSAATSFVLEAGTSPGATNVMAFDTLSAGSTFVSPGLPNGIYFVRVRALNAAGTSAPSNEITVSGAIGCAPGTPGNMMASVSGLNVAFQWNAAAGSPTSYELEAGTASGASNLGTFPAGLTTQFATAAPPGVYYVRVRARNACGVGPASNEVTVVIGQACTTAPTAPPTFTASLAGQVLTLAWAAAGGQPASYIIEAGTGSGAADIAALDVGSQLSFVTNVPPGAYFIRVRARNACGIGLASIERMVVVP